MATIKLNKNKPAASTSGQPAGPKRAPVRGQGVSRVRPTLAQAQAERAEKQAAFEQRRAAEAQQDRRGGGDFRGEGRGGDRRDMGRGDGPRGPRPDNRAGPRPDARPGERHDPRRGDTRGPRPEGRPGDRPDNRFGPRGDGRPGPRGDFRSDDRREDGPRGPYRPRYDRPDAPDHFGRPDGPARRYTEDSPAPRGPRPLPRSEPHADGERLSKRMSELGLASRREADEWIEAGWVKVDGKMAELGQRVGPDVHIEVDPAARVQQAQRVTILINKPIGYVSGQAEDGYEPASVLVKADTHWAEDPAAIAYAPGHSRGLAPAGRLDIDSTGLLVLTQDGRIAKHLIGEDSDVEKEYLVRVAVEGAPPDGHPQHQVADNVLSLLNFGLELDGVQLKPAKVSWANEDQLRFVLREGRKRQIRRMCELVGLRVLALRRVRIGRIPLGHLPPGQWRYLAPWERF